MSVTVDLKLSGADVSLIGGALSAQLRYARNGLEKAKEEDAINRWQGLMLDLKTVMEKIDAQVAGEPAIANESRQIGYAAVEEKP